VIVHILFKWVFISVVMIVFQSDFHLEMYQNNIFYFKKVIFDISIWKWYENIKKKIWSKIKIKIFKIFKKQK
jgi:hypothetical protein